MFALADGQGNGTSGLARHNGCAMDGNRSPGPCNRARERRTKMQKLVSKQCRGLAGTTPVPGDKSLSHRALIIAALAVGESHITGLLESDDVLATAAALRQLGVRINRDDNGVWHVRGGGIGGLAAPGEVLDFGNSGTGARLLAGVLASHPVSAVLTGDPSLRRRPMGRIAGPLGLFGAAITCSPGDRLPMTIRGARVPCPIRYRLPVPSAQVKSSLLLAALNVPGVTTIIEPVASRDHSERLLALFGARLDMARDSDGARLIQLHGQPALKARSLAIPGDFSAAAFAIVAALIVPDSALAIENTGINPTRSALLEVLRSMGGKVSTANARQLDGEPVADLGIAGSPLEGVEVAAGRVPAMVDEYPVLAVAAACARGRTVMRGLGELRHKESDRLAAMARGLAASGVAARLEGDDLFIDGAGGPPAGGAVIEAAGDHRIAMAFLVLGCVSRAPITVRGCETIASSFPGFADFINRLGGAIMAPDDDCGGR